MFIYIFIIASTNQELIEDKATNSQVYESQLEKTQPLSSTDSSTCITDTDTVATKGVVVTYMLDPVTVNIPNEMKTGHNSSVDGKIGKIIHNLLL